MKLNEVMEKLKELGTEQTKKTLMNHGICEPLFGVKITDMKKLVKYIKNDDDLVKELYNTGNYDAMYLSGLSINPKNTTKDLLEDWVKKSNCYATSEYTVARVAAESKFAVELAKEWINSENEMIATCGWSTYSNYISISNEINLTEIEELLEWISKNIHKQRNRVKYIMNGFVISAGAYITELNTKALEVAINIGRVEVDMGKTSCKVPIAKDSIDKIISMGRVGKKRKRCIC
jgi:3-methyladenine DNA glycosylase AlkD